jgi:hypothetical protein
MPAARRLASAQRCDQLRMGVAARMSVQLQKRPPQLGGQPFKRPVGRCVVEIEQF